MKNLRPTYIQQAETLQLILLANLFARKESTAIYFQGGTSLRWCYGGSRFSEDLDFETALSPEELRALLAKTMPAIRRDLTAHLGSGSFELEMAGCGSPLCKGWAKFSPANFRGNIAVKLEFQQLLNELRPETQPLILGSLPAVAGRIQEGRLKTGSSTVILVETLPEIMAGKVRALLERPAYKGRDFWDLWFLDYSLGVQLPPAILARKLRMYPFTMRRRPSDVLADLDDARREATMAAVREDLHRFVPPQALAALEHSRFEALAASVRQALASCPDELLPAPA